jgi:hypothetical protein
VRKHFDLEIARSEFGDCIVSSNLQCMRMHGIRMRICMGCSNPNLTHIYAHVSKLKGKRSTCNINVHVHHDHIEFELVNYKTGRPSRARARAYPTYIYVFFFFSLYIPNACARAHMHVLSHARPKAYMYI